jgi:hypothetical protein
MVRVGRIFAWVFAVFLFCAAVWYGLISQEITVDSPPSIGADEPLDLILRNFYDYWPTTLTQNLLNGLLGTLAFVCLFPVVMALRELFGRDRPIAALGALGVSIGALIWIVGNVIQLGGYRAGGYMIDGGNPLETVNSILFTIDVIDDWFELVGFGLIGLGLFGFAAAALQTESVSRAWGYYTAIVGALLFPVSAAYIYGNGDLLDLFLLIEGVILVPLWGVWVARLLSRAPVTSG